MDCNKYSDKLSFYVQNELSKDEQTEIAEHIRTCDSCRIKAEELSTLFVGLSQIEDVELPLDFHESLKSRAEKELWTGMGKKHNYMRFMKYLSVAAVFALCIFSAVHLGYFSGAKKDKAMSATSASTAESSSQKQASGNKETSAVIAYDRDETATKSDGSLAESTENSYALDIKAVNGQPQTLKDKYSDDISTSVNNGSTNSVTADVNPGIATNNGQEVKSDTAKADTSKTDTGKNETSKSVTAEAIKTPLVSASLLRLTETNLNVQIKTSDTEAAFKIVREHAAKLDAKVTPTENVQEKTTQNDTYSPVRSFAAPQVVQPDNIIIIEVKKENVNQFKALLEASFGKDNLHFDTDENISTDIVRFIIKIAQ